MQSGADKKTFLLTWKLLHVLKHLPFYLRLPDKLTEKNLLKKNYHLTQLCSPFWLKFHSRTFSRFSLGNLKDTMPQDLVKLKIRPEPLRLSD